MFRLGGIKLWGALAGMAALALLVWAAQDRFRLAGDLRALRGEVTACARAADPQSAAALDSCREPVRAAILRARSARQCDLALASANPDVTRFALRAACSAAVKREVAAREAAEAGQRAAEIEIVRLIAAQTGIAARAEARGRDQNHRKEAADDAIQSAPAADGTGPRKRCDAGCLRRLARAS